MSDQEMKMFGCKIEDYVRSVEESFPFQTIGSGMVIMSLLSDVQEMVERGLDEEARQALNKAKFLVDRYLPARGEQMDPKKLKGAYKIVSGQTTRDLETAVNEALVRGYVPYGSAVVSNGDATVWAQTMILAAFAG